MAPEQAQGNSLDARCDLFSLGCVLYRMATGEAPFRGTDMISTLLAVATENPAPPVLLNFELSTELSDFVMQLLAKEPKERPESAQAVAETLEHFATLGAACRAEPGPAIIRPGKPPLRGRDLNRAALAT
jgi:serine/threonine protein kinase